MYISTCNWSRIQLGFQNQHSPVKCMHEIDSHKWHSTVILDAQLCVTYLAMSMIMLASLYSYLDFCGITLMADKVLCTATSVLPPTALPVPLFWHSILIVLPSTGPPVHAPHQLLDQQALWKLRQEWYCRHRQQAHSQVPEWVPAPTWLWCGLSLEEHIRPDHQDTDCGTPSCAACIQDVPAGPGAGVGQCLLWDPGLWRDAGQETEAVAAGGVFPTC